MESDATEIDQTLMREAVKEAELALSEGEVPVGCVIATTSGKIVARGRNANHELGDATAHAEIVALRKMDDDVDYADLVLAVTCEPCVMCAAAIVHTHMFKRIIYGCANSRFGGCGSVRMVAGLPPLTVGVRAQDALSLLVRFYQKTNPYAPNPKPRRKLGAGANEAGERDASA